MYKLKIVKRGDTLTVFNRETGETIIDGTGNCDTPYLLDVSLTSKCSMACPYCYKKANQNGTDMALADFDILLQRMIEAKVFQVAYGGGNPNEHPYFVEFLRKTYEAGIVPNYSTNGLGMTDDVIGATAKYAGAVAVSIHKDLLLYKDIIEKLTSIVGRVNLHIIMTNDNAETITDLLTNPPFWMAKVNAIILLRYKNAVDGCGKEANLAQYASIFSATENCRFKVGFDACSYELIKRFLPSVEIISYDYCQGGRSSAYVDEHLIMSPCSFDKRPDHNNDLHNRSIKDIFTRSRSFIDRRLEINENKQCKQYFSDSCYC